jgi:DNA modification methylase
MKIELRPVTSIRPYDNNPRNNDDAVATVAESIRQYGFRQPIVVDADGIIVIGHTRWKAAQSIGLAEVPVHVASELTADQVRSLRITDNKTAELAEWDMDKLTIELQAIEAANPDIDLTSLGFDPDELIKLMHNGLNPGLTDPDSIPAAPDEAITRRGDLWLLGNHRLLCGDSSFAEDVDRLLDGARIHLVNTDPPYNVKVEPRSNNAINAGLSSFPISASTKEHSAPEQLRAKDRPITNDCMTDEAFGKMLNAWFGNIARVLEPGRAFYFCGGYANCGNYTPALKANELYFSQAIIWVKGHPVLGRKDYMGSHEWIFYGWREGAAHVFLGPNNVPDVWEVKKLHHSKMVHLTEKPVELAVRAMQYSSRPGEHVLDLFGGSGSTLIAAEQTGRKAFLMEIDPLYNDVIVQRYAEFTGTDPVLHRTDGTKTSWSAIRTVVVPP